jgi:hypothetical protein
MKDSPKRGRCPCKVLPKSNPGSIPRKGQEAFI